MQPDSRSLPGDGKLNPVLHIVKIVVVPRSGSPAHQSDALGQSHGLKDEELRAAEVELKKKPAPPSSGGTSPKNMFEALAPTDIVVVGREAASVRKVDSSGRPVPANAEPKPTPRLFAHDDRHRDTVLRVWTDSDTIQYQCDEQFEIVTVERAGWKIFGAPENPFDSSGKLPYRAEEGRDPTDGKQIWSWTSRRLPATANNQQYKIAFKINGELIDPDVACGDPPPTP